MTTATEWAQVESSIQDMAPSSSDLFDGDILGDELMDIYNAAVVGGEDDDDAMNGKCRTAPYADPVLSVFPPTCTLFGGDPTFCVSHTTSLVIFSFLPQRFHPCWARTRTTTAERPTMSTILIQGHKVMMAWMTASVLFVPPLRSMTFPPFCNPPITTEMRLPPLAKFLLNL